jgi:hypothetical protein
MGSVSWVLSRAWGVVGMLLLESAFESAFCIYFRPIFVRYGASVLLQLHLSGWGFAREVNPGTTILYSEVQRNTKRKEPALGGWASPVTSVTTHSRPSEAPGFPSTNHGGTANANT